jgi:hypothetical protein
MGKAPAVFVWAGGCLDPGFPADPSEYTHFLGMRGVAMVSITTPSNRSSFRHYIPLWNWINKVGGLLIERPDQLHFSSLPLNEWI